MLTTVLCLFIVAIFVLAWIFIDFTTAVLCLFILVLFFLAWIFIMKPLRKVRKILQIACNTLHNSEETTAAKKVQDSIRMVEKEESRIYKKSRLAEQLRRFERDWRDNVVKNVAEEDKSTTLPSDYLHLEHILPVEFSRNWLRAIPGVLTTSGILGTFIGLTIGLSKLSTSFNAEGGNPNPNQMSQGILGLMSGMSVAFLTSITGIALALLWIGIDRWLTRNAEKLSYELCKKLEELYPSLGPDDVWRHSLQIANDQKDSIKHLATDVATEVTQGMNKSIKEHLAPIVEQVANFTTQTQVEGMEKLVDKFGALLGERLQQQFDNLADTIEHLCNWQRSTKDNLDQVLIRIKEMAVKQDNMIDNATKAAQLFQESLGALGDIHQKLDSALSSFHGLSEGMIQLDSSMQTTSETLATTTERMSGLVQRQIEATETQVGQLEKLTSNLNSAMEKFVEDCRQGLQMTFSDFDEHLAELTSTLSGTIAETDETVRELLSQANKLRSAASRLVQTNQNFEENVQKFSNALKSSADNIGDGATRKGNSPFNIQGQQSGEDTDSVQKDNR